MVEFVFKLVWELVEIEKDEDEDEDEDEENEDIDDDVGFIFILLIFVVFIIMDFVFCVLGCICCELDVSLWVIFLEGVFFCFLWRIFLIVLDLIFWKIFFVFSCFFFVEYYDLCWIYYVWLKMNFLIFYLVKSY